MVAGTSTIVFVVAVWAVARLTRRHLRVAVRAVDLAGVEHAVPANGEAGSAAACSKAGAGADCYHDLPFLKQRLIGIAFLRFFSSAKHS